MKYALKLDYHIPEGRLGPYFEGLREGRAMATSCERCGAVYFPARLRCSQCGRDCDKWRELSGEAEILRRSGGPDDCFALVRFEGATVLTTVAITNPGNDTTTGVLVAGEEGRLGPLLRLDDG